MAAVAVETVAAAALRARLRSHGRVSVRLAANGWDMLAGRVDGAAVEGRLWESPLGLTARILDVEVGRVELDLGAALQQQRIVLRNVPLGAARVVFSGPDFGAFLQHPLVAAAASRAVQGLPFTFDREVLVLPPSASAGTSGGAAGGSNSGGGGATGAVLFSGILPATQQRYQLTMRPAQGGRAVTVTAVPVGTAAAAGAGGAGASAAAAAGAAALAWSVGGGSRGGGAATAAASLAPPAAGLSTASAGSSMSSASGSSSSLASSSADGGSDPVVSAELTRFFSRLTVDLQGAELAFDGLGVGQAAALAARDNARGSGGPKLAARDAAEGWIDLRLKATVRDFPPLNLQF